MRDRGGGAVWPAAILLAWLAAGCAAPEGAASADARAAADAADAADAPDAPAPSALANFDTSILGLPADQLRVEVEAGTGRTAIVRRRLPPAAPADAAAEAAADPAAAAPERPVRDREAAREAAREMAAARRELGLALERVGDIAGAVSEFEAALRAGPWAGDPEDTPRGDLARICRRGEPAEAVVRACPRALVAARYAPAEMAELIALRGDANARLGRTRQALDDYDTALEIDTSHYRALIGRARIRLREGRPATALNDLRLAIETGPRPAEARLERARAYAALGRFERAVADYDAVLADIAAAPLEPAAWQGRAVAHCAMGRAAAATVDWRLWADSVPGGAGYVQEMLRARDYLRAPWRAGIDPVIRDALAAWTRAGCP